MKHTTQEFQLASSAASDIIPAMSSSVRTPDDPDRTVSRDDDSTVAADARTLPVDVSASAAQEFPAAIGNYTILGKLGEGGMGVVYEAEQQSPRRKVALKVVRGGQLVTELSVKLFQREAETLGRLKHPNIGAIYESGRTAEGQHFFAMELVRGETLSRHMERRSPTLTSDEIRYRVTLLRHICDAVNYAHQRGVIHRDLKPSNILITEDGQPKILDFGLARITDADTEALSMVSEVGTIKGTLPYMSPEQTRGNPDEIDVRTDVYSLGIILYELLSGRLPYDTAKSGMVDAIRAITDADPSPFRSIPTVAKLAGGDVETMVRKALEKDPEQRYANAAALSDDIERYLTDQPIQAVPPGTIYQLRKFVRRNQWGVGVAVGAILVLAGFAVTSTVQAKRVAHARDESQAQAAKAQAMNGFLRNMLESADPWQGGAGDITVAATLDAAVKELGASFAGQPQLEAELRTVLGNTYYGIGRVGSSVEQLEEALEIRTRELGPDAPELAELWMKLAGSRIKNGDAAGAVAAAQEAVRVRMLDGPEPEFQKAEALAKLAEELWWASRPAEAESVLALSQAMVAQVIPVPEAFRISLLALEANLAIGYHSDLAAGDSLQTAALEIARARDDKTLASRINDLATLRMQRGDFASAQELFSEALEAVDRRFGIDHPEYAMILENSAQVDYMEKDYDAALTKLRRVHEIRARNLGEDHLQVLRTQLNVAAVAGRAGHPDSALAIYEELVPLLKQARGELMLMSLRRCGIRRRCRPRSGTTPMRRRVSRPRTTSSCVLVRKTGAPSTR